MRARREVKVMPEDLWFMLISHTRYAMGRMSSAVWGTQQLIRNYGRYLQEQQLRQIHREISDELDAHERAGKTLGMDCDHATWKETMRVLEQIIEHQQRAVDDKKTSD